MLGRLLHRATSSLNPNAHNDNPPLESVTEDVHTRSLLFPDASLLQKSQNQAYPLHGSSGGPIISTVGSYDDSDGLHLDFKKDFRLIIAQDAVGPFDEPVVLFDSQSDSEEFNLPPKPGDRARHSSIDVTATASARGHGSPAFASRLGNLFSPSASPVPPPPHCANTSTEQNGPMSPTRPRTSIFGASLESRRVGTGWAFDRARIRQSSISSSSSFFPNREDQAVSESQRTRAMLQCMFGTATLSYRGPSTKIHVFSLDTTKSEGGRPSPDICRDAQPSTLEHAWGRDRAPLTRRTSTSGSIPQSPAPSVSAEPRSDRKVLLVTRTFSLKVSEDDGSEPESRRSSVQLPTADGNGYPFPSHEGHLLNRARKAKQSRTPLFAVAIVLQLPKHSVECSRPTSRSGLFSPTMPTSPFFPPSTSSNSRNSWMPLDPPSSGGPMITDWFGGFDDCLDTIMDHWDIITRTLSHLESKARTEILALLQHMDLQSPLKSPFQEQSIPEQEIQRPKDRFLHLLPNALMVCKSIGDAVEAAGVRVCLGLSIPKVLRGQGRWGIWREEARWIERWVDSREHNSFLFVLLTAFLGNHTDWLNSLGPSWLKRRRRQRKGREDSPSIPSRTVIVSLDKTVARRLVFILCAFLPASSRLDLLHSAHRSRRPMSSWTYSGSPPVPATTVLRQESLRRTIDRRRRTNQQIPHDAKFRCRSGSTSTEDGPVGTSPGMDTPIGALNAQELEFERRSNRASILSSQVHHEPVPRCHATITETVMPLEIVPAPHFTTNAKLMKDDEDADSHSDVLGQGLASTNLARALQRSQSTNVSTDSTDSRPTSKWGSLISSFWSGHGESSTDDSDALTSSQDGLGISNIGNPKQFMQRHVSDDGNKLVQMAREAAELQEGESTTPVPRSILRARQASSTIGKLDFIPSKGSKPSKTALDHIEIPKIPLTISVDEKDGVIDVDIPLPSFLSSSVESTSSSPSKSMLSSDKDFTIPCSPTRRDQFSHQNGDTSSSTAGWLRRYHRDFALQAVRPYTCLEVDIRRSMKDEAATFMPPSLKQTDEPKDKWVDICSTVIADTRTLTVKRLRLRRRFGSSNSKQHINSKDLSVNGDFEEEIVEESIKDMDCIFSEAVERVLSRSGQSSKVQSQACSPSARGKGSDDIHAIDSIPTMEIPRGECKRTVLGALEQVTRSVTAETGRSAAVDISVGSNSKHGGNKRTTTDSALRAGVRKWLQDMDDGM